MSLHSNKKVAAAAQRVAHMNSLLCNVGLDLGVLVPINNPGGGNMMWALEAMLPYPAKNGVKQEWWTVHVYKHERSAVRAAWRLYRQRTGD